MNARDHSSLEKLLAVEALGGLDPDDRRTLEQERAAHGACEECRRLETSFGEVAGRLAFALDPEPVDLAIADRIVAEGSRPALVIPDVGATTPAQGQASRPVQRRSRRRWVAAVGVAAAVVLAVVASVVVLPGLGPTGTNPSPEQRFLRFGPETAGQGRLAMAYTPGSAGVVLWGSDLPDPGEGMVYEIWMISGTTPVSGGCVSPVQGRVAAYLDASLEGTDQMAVTREPAACPSAPTSAPILTATVA